MATPLEILKANRLENQQKFQRVLQSQGGYGDRIGRGLVGLAGAFAGAFDDPDEKAYADYQAQQDQYSKAQQAQGQGGAFTPAPYAPDYNPTDNLSKFSPEMRTALQGQETLRGFDATSPEKMFDVGNKLLQMGDERAVPILQMAASKQADIAKAAADAKGKSFRQEVTDESGMTRQGMFTEEGELIRYLGAGKRKEAKAPETRTFERNGQKVTEQWNAGQQRFEEIASSAVGKPYMSAEEQIRVNTATIMAEKTAEARAKGIGARESDDIATGTTVARAAPVLLRSIELLDEVQTGGIDAVKLKAKQILGIESGNEAELLNNMNKIVITQLKPVFGSQFTAKEGEWLREIEAGEIKSTDGNIRLLKTGINMSRKAATRALTAAKDAGDLRTAKEMQDFLLEYPEQAFEQPSNTKNVQKAVELDALLNKYK